jgi:hypothetical protein
MSDGMKEDGRIVSIQAFVHILGLRLFQKKNSEQICTICIIITIQYRANRTATDLQHDVNQKDADNQYA